MPKMPEGANFPLPEIEIRKELHQHLKRVMALGWGFVYILCIMFFIFWGRQNYKKVYLDRLNNQAAEIKEEMGGVWNQLNEIELTRALLAERQLPAFILLQLREIIGESIAVTKLSIDENYAAKDPAGVDD